MVFKTNLFLSMGKLKLPRSIKKWLRKEKARIRREIFDPREAEEEIEKLYLKLKEKFKEKFESQERG